MSCVGFHDVDNSESPKLFIFSKVCDLCGQK